MVVLIDADGRVLEVGPSVQPVLGYEPGALLGRSCFDLVHPDDRLLALEGLGHALVEPGRRLEHTTARVADASGSWRTMEVVARNRVEDPSVGGLVLTLRDRSGADEVEQEIAAREDRYRQIAELALEGVWCVDLGNLTTFVTHRMAAMLGYSVAEMVGRPLRDFVGEDEQVPAEELMARGRRGVAEEHALRLRHRSGRDVWTRMATTPIQGPDGSFLGSIALVTDVTEHRRAQQRLAESEARQRAVFDALPDLVFRVSADMTYLGLVAGRHYNPEFTPEMLLGLNLRDVLPADVVGPGQEAIEHTLATGEVSSFSWDADLVGEPRTYEVRTSAVDADEVVVLVRDVTDVRAGERARQDYDLEVRRRRAVEQQADLDRKMARAARLEALGRLAGGVAHDMNNLLGVIANYSAAIARSTGEESTAQDVEQIEQVVRRGTQLTKRLLMFGRRDGGSVRSRDLGAITSGVGAMLSRTLGTQHRLRIQVPDEPCWAAVDRGQFEQAVINLVLNAQDAAPVGSEITVSVVPVHRSVWISVSDRGPGMPAEVQERAFEPFFTTKEPGRGTGLGLAVVHGVAEEAGGDVRIDSSPMEGTTVSIVLPAVDAPDGMAPEDTADPSEHGAVGRVLVVDDEADALRSMSRLLSARGFEVATASSGQDALGRLEGGLEVDAVLSDVSMPGITGPALVHQLRTGRPGLPVVLVTGYGADLVDGLPEDVPLLPKPLEVEQLVSTLAGLLTRVG